MAVSEQPAAETAAESVNNEAVEETPAQVDNRASQEVPDDGIVQVNNPSPKEPLPSEDVVVSVDDESKNLLIELFKKIGMAMQACIITLLKFLLGKVHIKFIPQFSYQESKKAGLIYTFLSGNRFIYVAQLDKLWKDIKDLPGKVKRFSNPMIVVPLSLLIKNMPDLKVYDEKGKQYDASSPELDRVMVIIDAQHRVVVCMEHPEADVDVQVLDYTGDVHKLINDLNNKGRKWGIEDQKHANLVNGLSSNQLYYEAQEVQKVLACSTKSAEYLLTGKRDATKKSDLTKGKDTTIYDESKGKRGWNIVRGLSVGFNGVPVATKLQAVDSIFYVYENCGDENHPNFGRDMKALLAFMADDTKKEFVKHHNDKNYGTANELLLDTYNSYKKEHAAEMDVLAGSVDELYNKQQNDRLTSASSGEPTPIKVGTVQEILLNREAVAKYKEEQAKKATAGSSKKSGKGKK